MGSIIVFLIAKGVPARFAKPLLALVALIALAGILWAGIAIHDRNVVKTHDAGQVAATAVADRKADATAAVERRADDTRTTDEKTQLEKVQANAPSDLDRRLARQRCIRLQQDARRLGKQSPACAGPPVPGRAPGAH
jgi:uncharacterized iron-regulated membrane protein